MAVPHPRTLGFAGMGGQVETGGREYDLLGDSANGSLDLLQTASHRFTVVWLHPHRLLGMRLRSHGVHCVLVALWFFHSSQLAMRSGMNSLGGGESDAVLARFHTGSPQLSNLCRERL